ncbi:MAG: hypothetical protein HOD72_11415 [Opitutae bacterium]|nr:hypothetical protein [Opitutae bacterium]
MQFLALLLTLHAGEYDRNEVMVVTKLPHEYENSIGITLVRIEDKQEILTQRIPGNPSRFAFMLKKKLPAGKTRKYKLAIKKIKRPNNLIRYVNEGGKLTFRIGNKPVFTYNHGIQVPPKGIPEIYARSGFIHPIHSPIGQILTDDFPKKHHHHQHGLFHAHTRILIDKQALDGWNQKLQQVNIRHHSLMDKLTFGGPLVGGFTANIVTEDIRKESKTKKILNEKWDVLLYAHRHIHIFDIQIAHNSALSDPVEIKKYHYGGMALRGPEHWENGKPGVGIMTSDGMDRMSGNHTHPNWVDIHGPVDGQTGGIAVLSHPSSFRHPQHVRLHPQMPYICHAPMVAGNYKIPNNKPLTARYRYIAYAGQPDTKRNQLEWINFAYPPKVTFQTYKP